MRRFIQGFLAAVGLIVVGGAGYVGLGLAPVATTSAPLPFEKLITGIALNARVNREAPKSSPIPASEEVYAAGVPDLPEQLRCLPWVARAGSDGDRKGEFPKPPELFKGEGVTDDPVGDTYWKVANGIRLTGMPGFTGSLSSDQMWQVSLLLANADKLSPVVTRALQAPLAQ